ncbi:MAG: ribosome biogenesis GTPase YlqF [Clostridiales bacterium]|nr:ribosome biogenesis GTPase YlqF [Clostridiales bacterium]
MSERINWFPGHMKKAFGIIEENLKLVDAVLYVLDARAPGACINPEFERILAEKPRLYVISKADLVEDTYVRLWKDYFKERGQACLAINSISGVTGGVVKEVKSLLAEKIRRYEDKGIKKTLRIMVIGIPNSGKSTLINGVCKKKKTLTGDKPGVTKAKQWVKISEGLEMLDTPGALWPCLEDREAAKDLFFIGSIKQEIFDNTELALLLVEKLKAIAAKQLAERYKLENAENASPLEILNGIAKNRGYVLKGGETDLDRTAICILDDFKKARIGKIGLERPPKII